MNSELSQIEIAYCLLKEDTDLHHTTSDRRQIPGASTVYRNASVLGQRANHMLFTERRQTTAGLSHEVEK